MHSTSGQTSEHPVSLFDVTLSSGVREKIRTVLHDGYTQIALWSLLEWEIRRKHPDLDATIVAVNF